VASDRTTLLVRLMVAGHYVRRQREKWLPWPGPYERALGEPGLQQLQHILAQ
jgi:hypothetical protein